jgi:hypothetical protein
MSQCLVLDIYHHCNPVVVSNIDLHTKLGSSAICQVLSEPLDPMKLLEIDGAVFFLSFICLLDLQN